MSFIKLGNKYINTSTIKEMNFEAPDRVTVRDEIDIRTYHLDPREYRIAELSAGIAAGVTTLEEFRANEATRERLAADAAMRTKLEILESSIFREKK